ncbi:MAG: hypothetical protein C0469_00170 [Cyanobacteria bacterium DS2.3.42]|nr:hypothetical protein [Cyanobacteria bacterium DS2.3.42]
MTDNCNLADRAKLPLEESAAGDPRSARKTLSECAFDAMKKGEGGLTSPGDAVESIADEVLQPVEITQPATSSDIVRGTWNVAKDIAVGAVNEFIDNPLGVAKTAACGAILGGLSVAFGPEIVLLGAAGYGAWELGHKLYDDGIEKTGNQVASSLSDLGHDFAVEFAPQKFSQTTREKAQAHIEGFGAQGLHFAAAVGGGVGGSMAISSLKTSLAGSLARNSVDRNTVATPDMPHSPPVPHAEVQPPATPPLSSQPPARGTLSSTEIVPPSQNAPIGTIFPATGRGGTPAEVQLTASPGDAANSVLQTLSVRSVHTVEPGSEFHAAGGARVTIQPDPNFI